MQSYVQYVMGAYSERFGNPHVTAEIMQYVAEVMTKLYPSLRDKDSDPDNPAFVSIIWYTSIQPPVISNWTQLIITFWYSLIFSLIEWRWVFFVFFCSDFENS